MPKVLVSQECRLFFGTPCSNTKCKVFMIVYIVFLNFVVPSPPKNRSTGRDASSDVASSSSSDDGVDDDDFQTTKAGNNLKF